VNATALHDWHVAAGAKMAAFAGYDMPISYPTGAVEEHLACRRSVGLFDVAHMGRIELSGPAAESFLSALVSSSILGMKTGDARYALLLNEEGGVLDDLFVYRLASSYLVVANASNREADLAWINSRAEGGVELVDRSEESYMIAVQGPAAIALLDRLSEGAASAVPRFSSTRLKLGGTEVLFGRTGYTGEDGGELFFPAERALDLWRLLLDEGRSAGIETLPIGLAARDSLRFEAGMSLHGHEISASVNPLEAGLKWACDFSKDFVGKAALERAAAEGLKRKLACLDVTGGVPREGYEVVAPSAARARAGEGPSEGAPSAARVGICVSGMFCPTVAKYAANAFVEPSLAAPGTELGVMIREKMRPAVVVKRPLYVPAYRR